MTIDRASYQRIYSNAYQHGKQGALRAALPAEPTPEAIDAMMLAMPYRSYHSARAAYRALRAHLLGEGA